MAMRVSNSRALASALRSSRVAFVRRNEPNVRFFGSTPRSQVVVSSDQPNMRHAQRAPDEADDLHRYGSWLMGCLPKYIQQFSVWKDELVIYISPAGVIPVFSFLKCMNSSPSSGIQSTDTFQITLLPNLQQYQILQL
jgi:NADH dehydrogenase (ubiquinone) Fe-S protein 3